MKKFIKISLIVLGIIVIGLVLLIFSFIQGMKPDKKKEEKVRVQAEQYLKDNFDNNFEIFDTLYDNMGNFEFEYAAKVMDNKTKTQFLVYYDSETNQMMDTYIAKRWAKDLENEIRPFIRENLGKKSELYVFFDDKVGKELGIDPVNPKSYKEFHVSPTIRITVPRKRSEGDEIVLNEFIKFILVR
ncbi:hypothetical protein J2S13_003269 [Oikeobacillus pervagus]|uniref:Uncharacterized protein n=1 Tax=Oikeobacillus pervagus TaxID=1325931 RepID=A0AAJ1WKQ8_9BACI|nr:hypothetical protein [Oikeobacillus pervagus]MDQ0216783.1 hypothetical protein [Oikeobacillus pervagus]